MGSASDGNLKVEGTVLPTVAKAGVEITVDATFTVFSSYPSAWAYAYIYVQPEGEYGTTVYTKDINRGTSHSTIYKFLMPSKNVAVIVGLMYMGSDAEVSFTETVTFDAPPPDKGRLVVNTNPSNADISIDGSFVGTSPVSVELTPGLHHIGYGELVGYIAPPDENVTIEVGYTLTIMRSYTPIVPTGNLVVKTVIEGVPVEGCNVYAIPKDMNKVAAMNYYEGTTDISGVAIIDAPADSYLIYAIATIDGIDFFEMMDHAVLSDAGGYVEFNLREVGADEYIECDLTFSIPVVADMYAAFIGNIGNYILDATSALGLSLPPIEFADAYAKDNTLFVRFKPKHSSPYNPLFLFAALLCLGVAGIIVFGINRWNANVKKPDGTPVVVPIIPKIEIDNTIALKAQIDGLLYRMQYNCELGVESELVAAANEIVEQPSQKYGSLFFTGLIGSISEIKKYCAAKAANPNDPRLADWLKRIQDMLDSAFSKLKIPQPTLPPINPSETGTLQVDIFNEKGEKYKNTYDGELTVILHKCNALLGCGPFIQCDPLLGLFLCSYGNDYTVVTRVDLKKHVNLIEFTGLESNKYAVDIYYRGDRVAVAVVTPDMLNKRIEVKAYDKIMNYQLWWWHTYKWHFYAGAGVATVAAGWLLWKAVEKPRAFYVPQFKRSG